MFFWFCVDFLTIKKHKTAENTKNINISSMAHKHNLFPLPFINKHKTKKQKNDKRFGAAAYCY